jgi:hypothetical protein
MTDTNTWYTLDSMPCSEEYESEYMMINIRPINRLWGPLSGTYIPPIFRIPYRYLMSSTYLGAGADFLGGQYLQFMKSHVTVLCPEGATGSVRFYGDADITNGSIYVYTRGDYQTGFRVDDGALAIYPGGGFYMR